MFKSTSSLFGHKYKEFATNLADIGKKHHLYSYFHTKNLLIGKDYS